MGSEYKTAASADKLNKPNEPDQDTFGGSTITSGGGSTLQQKGSGTFQNLKAYIDANKGKTAKLGQSISSGFENKANAIRNELGNKELGTGLRGKYLGRGSALGEEETRLSEDVAKPFIERTIDQAGRRSYPFPKPGDPLLPDPSKTMLDKRSPITDEYKNTWKETPHPTNPGLVIRNGRTYVKDDNNNGIFDMESGYPTKYVGEVINPEAPSSIDLNNIPSGAYDASQIGSIFYQGGIYDSNTGKLKRYETASPRQVAQSSSGNNQMSIGISDADKQRFADYYGGQPKKLEAPDLANQRYQASELQRQAGQLGSTEGRLEQLRSLVGKQAPATYSKGQKTLDQLILARNKPVQQSMIQSAKTASAGLTPEQYDAITKEFGTRSGALFGEATKRRDEAVTGVGSAQNQAVSDLEARKAALSQMQDELGQRYQQSFAGQTPDYAMTQEDLNRLGLSGLVGKNLYDTDITPFFTPQQATIQNVAKQEDLARLNALYQLAGQQDGNVLGLSDQGLNTFTGPQQRSADIQKAIDEAQGRYQSELDRWKTLKEQNIAAEQRAFGSFTATPTTFNPETGMYEHTPGSVGLEGTAVGLEKIAKSKGWDVFNLTGDQARWIHSRTGIHPSEIKRAVETNRLLQAQKTIGLPKYYEQTVKGRGPKFGVEPDVNV